MFVMMYQYVQTQRCAYSTFTVHIFIVWLKVVYTYLFIYIYIMYVCV